MLNSIAGLTTVLEKKARQEETHNQLLKDMRAEVKDTLERNEDLSAKMDRTLNTFNETTAKTLKADIRSFINHDLNKLRTELAEIRASSKEMTAASASITKHEGTLSKLGHQPAEITELKTRMGNLECAFGTLRTDISNNNASIQPIIALAPVMQQVLVTMSQIQATLLQQTRQAQQLSPQIIYQTNPSMLHRHPSLQRLTQPEHGSASGSGSSAPPSPQMPNSFTFTPPSSNPSLAREDTDPPTQPMPPKNAQNAHEAYTQDKLSSIIRQNQNPNTNRIQNHIQTHDRHGHTSIRTVEEAQQAVVPSAHLSADTHAVSAQAAFTNASQMNKSNLLNTISSGLSDATTTTMEARDPMLSSTKLFKHTNVEVVMMSPHKKAAYSAATQSSTSDIVDRELVKQTAILPDIVEEKGNAQEGEEEEEDMQATQIISSQSPEAEEIPQFLQYTQATQAVPTFLATSHSTGADAVPASIPALAIPSYRERERSQSLAPTVPPAIASNDSTKTSRPPNSSDSTSSSMSIIQLPKKRKITQMEEEEEELTQLESSESLPDVPATKASKQKVINNAERSRQSSPDEPLSNLNLQYFKSLAASSSPSTSALPPRGSKLPRVDSNDAGTPSSAKIRTNKPTPTRSGARSNTAKRGKPFARKDTGTRQTTRADTRSSTRRKSPEV